MATIPLQLSQRRLDTGNVVQYPQGGEVGRAMQGVGEDLGALAERYQQRQDEMARLKRIASEDAFNQTMENDSAELVRNWSAPDGAGIHDSIAGVVDQNGVARTPGLFDALAKQFREQVPESQRPYFDASLPAKRLEWSGRAAKAQYEREQTYASGEIAKINNGIVTSILQMPNPSGDAASFDALKAKGSEVIKASPLAPAAKQAALDAWEQTAPKALAEAITAQNPGQLRALLGMPAQGSTGSPVDDVTDHIIGVESGGNANAKNPNSSASGVGQFLDSTWVATVRAHRPDIAAGKSAAQIIALKGDAKLGREMTKAYSQDNADYLTNRGLPTTRGNIYLAHFLGPAGATEVLKADPTTPVVNIVGQDVVNANPFLKGMTAADTAAWAEKKMGGSARAMDPRFKGMSPDDMLALANKDDVAFRERQNREAAVAKADYESHKDDVTLGIRTGQIIDPAVILQDGRLNNGDKATLFEMQRTQNKENAGVADLIGTISNGGKISINPFDETQTKLGDKGYDAFVAGLSTDQRGPATGAYVAATGYIPKKVQASLQQGAASTDPAQFSAAMGMADALRTRAPTAFDNFDGGKQVRDNLTLFQHMVNDRGLSADEASRKIIAMNDPEKRASREVLKPKAEKFLKDLSVGDVTSDFDANGWWPGGKPGAGLLPAQQNALLAEYKELAEERFYETGDTDAAKALALQDIKRTWGPSSVSGSPQLMRMPPENHYPPAGGSFDYLREDAMKTAQDYVAKTFPDRTVTNVAIAPGIGRDNSWSTRGDIDAKRPPRYRLFYTYEHDGQQMVDEVLGAPWGVDAAGVEAATAKAQAGIGAQFDQARQKASTSINDFKAGEAAAQKALDETPGPSWMKARAAEMARERARQDAGERRMKAQQQPKAEPGSNIPTDLPDQSQFDIMGNPTGF